jgi:predicted nucleotidyltransferase
MNGFFARLLGALVEAGVEFVIVGGVAGRFHGSSLLTDDVDIVYRRTRENIERLARALAPLHPRLRGADDGLPFIFDAETIRHGLNFTLSTDAGPIDCLGEISGIGGYEAAAQHAVPGEVFGLRCLFLSLDDLITAKRAAARRKDAEMLAQLEVIREELRRLG